MLIRLLQESATQSSFRLPSKKSDWGRLNWFSSCPKVPKVKRNFPAGSKT